MSARNEGLTYAQSLALAAGTALVCVLSGWLIAHGEIKYIVDLGVLAVVGALAARAPGPLGALLLLTMMNGIPFVDLSGRLPGGAHVQDGAVLVLIGLLYAYRHQGAFARPRRARIARAATVWGVCFAGYWVFTLMRSWLLDGVPLLKAALFGRDFLYFALLLPLAIRAELPAGSLRAGGRVLAGGVILFAIGAVVTSLSSASLTWLVHPLHLADQVGLTRVYSYMGDAVNAGFIFGAAYVISNKGGRHRKGLAVLTVLLGTASVLQLTRANYLGLGAGLLAGFAIWIYRYASLRSVLMRGGVVILILSALVLGVIGSGVASRGSTPVAGVVTRVQGGFTDLAQSSGSVGYRETVYGEMLQVLGRSWPAGLGFLHPQARYVSLLPSGSIRNSDTGVFNVLMTMGLLGVLFIYAPLAYGLIFLVRHRRSDGPRVHRWVVVAGTAWIAFAVAGSATLILLFSVSGVALVALVLAGLGRELTSQEPEVARA